MPRSHFRTQTHISHHILIDQTGAFDCFSPLWYENPKLNHSVTVFPSPLF